MSNLKGLGARKRRPITSSDVGRYLRQLAMLNKDPRTGNPELSDALFRLSTVLTEAKAISADVAASRAIDQRNLLFDDDIDFSNISLAQAREILADDKSARSSIVIVGSERMGITRSRLEKLSRDELVQVVKAAIEHEESLQIISQEAERGGRNRES